ncbi:MAG: hypothetical protein ACJ0BF_04575 [Gammaproteobacteria bacterium]
MKKIVRKVVLSFFKKNKDIYLVDPHRDEDFLIESLSKEHLLGIDTEFDWRNTYFPKLSLLQIATESKIYLIDCLKVKNINFLRNLLESKNKLIVFHSSRSDTTVLFTNLNISIQNVFDIQIAEKNISKGEIENYASLVNKYFHINLKKTETNSNWLRRPFSEEQLSYAANDVNFLIEIYKLQLKILKKKNLLVKTLEDSKREANLGNQDLSISRVKKLNKASKIEKSIFLWRENYAKDLNIPSSHIFNNKNLKKLAFLSQNNKIEKKEIHSYFKKSLYVKDFIEFLKN